MAHVIPLALLTASFLGVSVPVLAAEEVTPCPKPKISECPKPVGHEVPVELLSPPTANGVSVCLITRTDTNPYFVKMKEGATAKAGELGMQLKTYAGKIDGDSESQVAAIESCIADGAKGILIAASDTKGIVSSVKKARDAGLLVIALDTPLEPIDAADSTFTTDNFRAGAQIGAWAKAKLGDAAKDAKIAYLDLNPAQPTIDVLSDQGFMAGFGIDTKDANKIGDEDDARNVCHEVTNGDEEGGRKAMENCLQKDQGINVVYSVNELAAAGAYQALKAVGMERNVLIVSVNGSCSSLKNVKEGVIGATSQELPMRMAILGINAIAIAANGKKVTGFFDSGANLVTDRPMAGVESIDTATGINLCWG
ncbi:substrate-binding domain-containing protein [Rhizobium leguminosarum]|nr:substrate-binding domain-containing protein [Rhizobium ruizarguesonis]NEK13136.1 substrate-binding domain-containing protein [Rhizobium ruizarguesonis]